MYKQIVKDALTLKSGVLAHGCNMLGVMGGGIAWAIANKWPIALSEYENHLIGGAQLGEVSFVKVEPNIIVANCLTQPHVGFYDGKPPAKKDAIRASLGTCIAFCNSNGYDLYAPQIGAGLGGLDWKLDVEPIFAEVSEQLDSSLNFYVCVLA